MHLLQINTEVRVIIGISAMVFLFTSFLISFISSQRKKIQYHKDLHAVNEQQQLVLTQQNELLENGVKERTEELLKQKEALEISLSNLKSAQLHLVQKEKMASLGELTAGIAHEIQNPLNFVNNFSEVNIELANELKVEIDKIDIPLPQKDNLASIADDLLNNQIKINHHGKRADAIVKSMLQHSRSGSGYNERTNINALAEEYLRLSYHKLRAGDKLFTVTIETDFDENVEIINIVPQDMSRVFVNLFTNAFYSVTQKSKLQPYGYNPTVWVRTKKINPALLQGNNRVEICIKDNGNGIPDKILDKIFQPFFTTKPSGDGAGLGLSISYDIIKAHGGEIKVKSKAGEGAEFVIQLPVV